MLPPCRACMLPELTALTRIAACMLRINHNQPPTWDSWGLLGAPPAPLGFSLSLPTLALWNENTGQLYYFRICQIAQLLDTESPAINLSANLYQLVFISQPPPPVEASGSNFPKFLHDRWFLLIPVHPVKAPFSSLFSSSLLLPWTRKSHLYPLLSLLY